MSSPRGISELAVTYTNNDYGKGLSDSFVNAFKAMGGSVTAEVPHEDGKGDYSAEVSTLSASGATEVAVLINILYETVSNHSICKYKS